MIYKYIARPPLRLGSARLVGLGVPVVAQVCRGAFVTLRCYLSLLEPHPRSSKPPRCLHTIVATASVASCSWVSGIHQIHACSVHAQNSQVVGWGRIACFRPWSLSRFDWSLKINFHHHRQAQSSLLLWCKDVSVVQDSLTR